MLSMSCLFYGPQRSWGTVMFLLVSVILFTGGYPSMHCRWHPSMPCSRSPGAVSRPTPKREVERSGQGGSPGSHPAPGGCLRQGGDPPMTATAGGGTHPTGMHSCHVCVVLLCRTVILLLSTFVISDCYVYCFMSWWVVYCDCRTFQLFNKVSVSHSGVWGRVSWYFLATSLTLIMVRFVQMIAPGPTFVQVPSNRLGIHLMGMHGWGHFVKLSRHWCT